MTGEPVGGDTSRRLEQCHHCKEDLQVACEKRISAVAVRRTYEHIEDHGCPLKAIHVTVSHDRDIDPPTDNTDRASVEPQRLAPWLLLAWLAGLAGLAALAGVVP